MGFKRFSSLARQGLLPLLLSLSTAQAWAGAQIEEHLADSVRTGLSAAIADGSPPQMEFASEQAHIDHLLWVGAMGERLKKRLPDFEVRREFLETVWYESTRAGLDPALVLGLIEVESAFRKFAVSPVGARGLMQVMPFWARQIGDGDPSHLFHTQANLRFGCVILRYYLNAEHGDLFMALGRYNGSRGRSEYPNAVFAARQHWESGDVATARAR